MQEYERRVSSGWLMLPIVILLYAAITPAMTPTSASPMRIGRPPA